MRERTENWRIIGLLTAFFDVALAIALRGEFQHSDLVHSRLYFGAGVISVFGVLAANLFLFLTWFSTYLDDLDEREECEA